VASDPLSLRSLKFRRAQRHLRELHRIIGRYKHGSPYVPTDQSDLQRLRPGALAGLRIRRGPPQSISVSLGDALQDLKSALDHAVYELARIREATPIQLEDSEFLIAEDPAWYRGNRKRRLGAIGPDALEYVDSLQPHLGLDAEHPHRAVLRTIRQLARIDRHRYIHVARLAIGEPIIGFGPPTDALTRPPLQSDTVHLSVAFPIRVGVDEPELVGFLPLEDILDEIEMRTGEILVRLGDFRG
jgi:hypothetical protein